MVLVFGILFSNYDFKFFTNRIWNTYICLHNNRLIYKKTEKYGEICYGIVTNVYPDGSYVNNAPEYQADVYLYITSEGRTDTITEIIGFDPMKYPTKSYVKVKYYQGDINIIEGLNSIKDVPMATQRYFKEYEDFREQAEDIIIVNGKKYKRIDE